jgi:muramoyltetrapeptide carboxypeptidase
MVGVAAPASPFDRQAFERGVGCLRRLGLEVCCPDGVFARDGYLAGSDAHRAELLNTLFDDDRIRAIFCARGGYGTMRILPHLDFALIKTHPKILVGYSDITALLSAVHARTGLVAFHGPLITELDAGLPESLESMQAALMGAQPVALTSPEPRVLRAGSGRGIVAGGNLTTLVHLLGTPFAPNLKGAILFLEDRGEAPYRIDRMLVQMKLAGCFDRLAGLMLGGFEDCGEEVRIHRVVKGIVADYAFPAVAGFPLGHGQPNLTLPVGLPATLDALSGRLQYEQSPTRGAAHAGG